MNNQAPGVFDFFFFSFFLRVLFPFLVFHSFLQELRPYEDNESGCLDDCKPAFISNPIVLRLT